MTADTTLSDLGADEQAVAQLAAVHMLEVRAKRREAAQAKYAPIVRRLPEDEFLGLMHAVAGEIHLRYPEVKAVEEAREMALRELARPGLGNR